MQYKFDMQQVDHLMELAEPHYQIEPDLYMKYEVKRGLRDLDGRGVRAGLTTISKVSATQLVDGKEVSAPGQLLYRGIPIDQLVQGFITHNRFGFEEIVYLLLMGRLPKPEEMQEFHQLLAHYQELPNHFNSGVIMKMPSDNIMNTMAKCVLALHAYDPKPDDISLPNVMRQCLQLIAQFPSLAVFGYQASMYFRNDKSMFIQKPDPKLTIAENILYMMRPDGKYTQLEAKLLDLCLVLHAEHGGGNNSAFTVHVVSSSGTDTYSTVAAALGSLKGPKHGGANIKVMEMFRDLKANCRDWKDEDAIRAYLSGLLRGEGFDHTGLIYGMGHAVYSVSDPRAVILKGFVEQLSAEKGCHEEFELYATVERLAKEVITQNRKIYKGVCANVDFYSGFVYRMLGLPVDLYTPIFAIARIAGWSAHRLEELINCRKIIRPAYLSVAEPQPYVPMEER
ncbi:citrate/2-methylcitrate synthase [uncultured Ruminococcus sp.]|uniref:citrate/2-methylcitrate synthase n=2 Tax=uncultured Ruminococcus sp. TaxID=165186 RepID=UPI002805EFD4|nr:citrate/2-methylcitrate synthase [uncultured Ruminococcus sp.]